MNVWKNAFRRNKSPDDTPVSEVRPTQSSSSVDVSLVVRTPSAVTTQNEPSSAHSVTSGTNVLQRRVKGGEELYGVSARSAPSQDMGVSALEAIRSADSFDSHFSEPFGYQKRDNEYLVFSVVAQLHDILEIALPRFLVALLCNYRHAKNQSGHWAEVDQLDLYLSNLQDYLQQLKASKGGEMANFAVTIGRTIAVLASVIELVGRNVSGDFFMVSFDSLLAEAICSGTLKMTEQQCLAYLSDKSPVSITVSGSHSGFHVYSSSSQTDYVTDSPGMKPIAFTSKQSSALVQLAPTSAWVDEPRNSTPRTTDLATVHSMVQRHVSVFTKQLEQLCHRLAAQLDAFAIRIQNVYHLKDKIEEELIAQQNDLRKLLRELLTRDEQLATANATIQALEIQVQQTGQQFEKLQRDHHALTEGPKRDSEIKQKAYDELISRTRELEGELIRVQERYTDLVKDACQRQSIEKDMIIRQLQAGLNAAIADCNEAEQQSEAQKAKLDRLCTALNEKDDAIQELSKKLAELKSIQQTPVHSSTNQESGDYSQSTEVQKLRNRCHDLEEDNMALKLRLDETMNLSSQSVSSVNVASVQNEEQADELRSLNDTCARYSAQITALQNELHDQSRQLQLAIKERDLLDHHLKTCQKQTDVNQDLMSNLKETKIDNERLRHQLTCGESAVAMLKERLAILEQAKKGELEMKRIAELDKVIQEKDNIIRAMEFGRETLTLRLKGVEKDKDHADNMVRDLQNQLKKATAAYESQMLNNKKHYETKLSEALARLAQKGEQYEFAKSNIEKLIKREEELNAQLAHAHQLRSQAETKLERLADQSSREIDELELQIKALQQEQDTKFHQKALRIVHCGTMTPLQEQCNHFTQTSLSFVYGFDLETGMRISDHLYVKSTGSKACQVDNPTETNTVSCQVRPKSCAAAVQATQMTFGICVQTDLDYRHKQAQADCNEIRVSLSCQSGEFNRPPVAQISRASFMKRAAPLPMPRCVQGKMRLQDESKTIQNQTADTEDERSSSDEPSANHDNDDVSSASFASGPSDIAQQVAPPRPSRMPLSSKSFESTSNPALQSSCQYIYDALACDEATVELLQQISDELNYSKDGDEFHRHFLSTFHSKYAHLENVQRVLGDDLGEELDAFMERTKSLIRGSKSSASHLSGIVNSFQLVNQSNDVYSLQILFDKVRERGRVIELVSYQYPKMSLQDFNATSASLLYELAPYSKTLKYLFLPLTKISSHDESILPRQFAVKAIRFMEESNKLRSLLGDRSKYLDAFMQRYRLTVGRSKIGNRRTRLPLRRLRALMNSLRAFPSSVISRI